MLSRDQPSTRGTRRGLVGREAGGAVFRVRVANKAESYKVADH